VVEELMDVRFGDDEAGLLTVSSIAVVVDVSEVTVRNNKEVNELDVGSGDGSLAVVFEGGVVRNREQIVDVCDTHAASLEGESKEGA